MYRKKKEPDNFKAKIRDNKDLPKQQRFNWRNN